MRFLAIAFVVLGAVLIALPASALEDCGREWELESPEHSIAGDGAISETVWSLSRPHCGVLDRIGLHRYRAASMPVAALFYLPGTNMNGAIAITDETHNLLLFLAAHGFDVYALDYRTHAISPETDATTLSELKTWDTAQFVEDAALATDLARFTSGRGKLFLAGFSRGAFLAYSYAAANPQYVAGLVILDGSFKSAAPKPFDADTALAELEASGKWASDVGGKRGWVARQAMMEAAATNPDGPATDPKFKTAGEQLAHVLQNAWGPGGLANPEGGVSKPQVLATLMRGYDRYYPAIQDIEGKRMSALADDATTGLDDGWGEMSVPILAFTSTGMGADWQANVRHSAEASGSKDVTVHVLDGYGHLDVLVAEKAPQDVFQPVADWIAARAKAAP